VAPPHQQNDYKIISFVEWRHLAAKTVTCPHTNIIAMAKHTILFSMLNHILIARVN